MIVNVSIACSPLIIGVSSVIVLLSNRYAINVSLKCGIPIEKLCFINNPNTFKIQSCNIENKSNEILFVGRISDSVKNTIDFIKMWELIWRNHTDWCAKLIGIDDGCDDLKKYIKEHNIKNIEFVGFSNNIKKYFLNGSILCLTSHYEGWPMVINEARTLGCIPIVYGSFEAAYDMIENGKDGFICSPYNYNEMANVVSRLIKDKYLRDNIVSHFDNKLIKFDATKIADQWIELFNKIKNS